MRWRGRRRSKNIEDRQGQGSPRGLGRDRTRTVRLPRGRRGKLGIVGILAIVGISLFLGIDPIVLLQGGLQSDRMQPTTQSGSAPTVANDDLTKFVSVVLADTEDTWHGIFDSSDRRYQEPTLVLFSNAVQSACGYAQSAMGPFYCPGDQKVYLDLTFFRELSDRFGAPGDFAQAYVIAHEVGHHVQTLLGISQKVHEQRSRVSKVEANKLSVRQELQADCFAGIWAYNADRSRNLLEEGDIEEALNAATAIGDDRLQKKSTGRIVPDSFTHGTSRQRVKWFMVGFETGDVRKCDTFGTDEL